MLTPALRLFSFASLIFLAHSTEDTCSVDSCSTVANPTNWKQAKSIYEFTVNDIHGNPVSLEKYKGHVCIIVNVASQCGYTEDHYKELVELYEEYSESKGQKQNVLNVFSVVVGYVCRNIMYHIILWYSKA